MNKPTNRNDAQQKLQFHIGERDEGLTLVTYLRGQHGFSRRMLTKLRNEGEIQVNENSALIHHLLRKGDIITLIWPEEDVPYIEGEPLPLDIRHEDEHLMVINKQAGMVVHPTMNYQRGTLANAVLYHWHEQGLMRTFRPVNRLDKDTSGLLIVAKNAWVHDRLAQLHQQGGMQRTYLAIVHGSWDREEAGTINMPIARKRDSIIEREVHPDGSPAITHWQVVERGSDMTLLQVMLETGRTHQIRVHFSHIGYPLAGDDLYGGKRKRIGRQALHAHALSFVRPYSGEKMQFTADMPHDMKDLWENREIN